MKRLLNDSANLLRRPVESKADSGQMRRAIPGAQNAELTFKERKAQLAERPFRPKCWPFGKRTRSLPHRSCDE